MPPKTRGRLQPWQAAELAAVFVQVDLAGQNADDVVIKHNVRLPRVDGGSGRRQFDATIRGQLNGTEFLRVIEVQKQSRAVGLPTLDGWIAKAESVGAHRLTTVASDYQQSALDEVKRQSHRLDAFLLRSAKPEDRPRSDMPVPGIGEMETGKQRLLQTDDYLYSSIDGSPLYYVIVGRDEDRSDMTLAIVLQLPIPPSGPYEFREVLLAHGPVEIGGVSMGGDAPSFDHPYLQRLAIFRNDGSREEHIPR